MNFHGQLCRREVEWNRHSVQEVLQPRSPDNTICPDLDAMKVLAKMNSSGQSRLMVADGDQLVGVIVLRSTRLYGGRG
jgi:CBS domain-containing protein